MRINHGCFLVSSSSRLDLRFQMVEDLNLEIDASCFSVEKRVYLVRSVWITCCRQPDPMAKLCFLASHPPWSNLCCAAHKRSLAPNVGFFQDHHFFSPAAASKKKSSWRPNDLGLNTRQLMSFTASTKPQMDVQSFHVLEIHRKESLKYSFHVQSE